MKTRKTLSNWLVACGFAVAAVLATQCVQAQAVKDGKATVKFVSGTVNYAGADGVMKPLTVGTEISTGTTVQSADNTESYADLSINNRTALIRVTPGTTVKIDKMNSIGGTDTETALNLKEGTVLGSVKKLSKASRFDIKVLGGVAGIRGTDFAVTVKRLANDKFEVTFTSVKGEVVAVANVPGRAQPVTNVLHDGDSWTPGGEVVQVDCKRFIDNIRDCDRHDNGNNGNNGNNGHGDRPDGKHDNGNPDRPWTPVSPHNPHSNH